MLLSYYLPADAAIDLYEITEEGITPSSDRSLCFAND